MIKKQKIAVLTVIYLMLLSAFAVLTPEAAATGEWQIGSISIDDNTFSRCYDYTYESTHDGHPSSDVWDTAYITASLPAGVTGYDCDIQARLMKSVYVDGYLIRNGYFIDNTAIGLTNGVVWVDDQIVSYYDYYGTGDISFEYALSWNSIFYGYDIWPNYWSPDDFANDWGGFAGHTIDVTFAIEWYQVIWTYPPSYSLIGATQEIPDIYNPGLGYSAYTSHTDHGWESWTFLIPDDEIHFACSTQYTDVWGDASITNPYEAQYRTPDSSYATFLAASDGSTARASYWIGGTTSGTVWIYGDSMYAPYSRFLVYVSSDGSAYSWRLASEQLVSNGGDRWIDCGTPSGTYSFVLVIAWDAVSESYMKIDCINCGGHY